jgi:uncharacterized protein YqcC (DUF446 family)
MEPTLSPDELRAQVGALADALELELRGLGRWSDRTPPAEAFKDMAPFGGRTMGFEQWIQFVLIPRIREALREGAEFPSHSAVGVYAVRALDGDYDADRLCSLLSDLDWVIERRMAPPRRPRVSAPSAPPASTETSRSDDATRAAVLSGYSQVLPLVHGEDLEQQLQIFDLFAQSLPPAMRPELSALLTKAAAATADPTSRARLERAARSIADGGKAVD